MTKSYEEMDLERTELDLEMSELNVKAMKIDQENNRRIIDQDLFASRQEIVRRNIEACMNILRIENRSAAGVAPCISKETRELAEKRCKEFLNKLDVL